MLSIKVRLSVIGQMLLKTIPNFSMQNFLLRKVIKLPLNTCCCNFVPSSSSSSSLYLQEREERVGPAVAAPVYRPLPGLPHLPAWRRQDRTQGTHDLAKNER